MKLLPDSNEIKSMLEQLDISSIQELFGEIPPKFRKGKINLAGPKSELEVKRILKKLLDKNANFEEMPSFIGSNVQPHWVPAVVDAIVSRSEFYSAYFSYQPEISQGMLQTLFEYQSLICELYDMEVAPIGLYDGSSALGEAARLCSRVTRKDEFLIPENTAENKKAVLKNYTRGCGIRIKEYPFDRSTGKSDFDRLEKMITDNCAGVFFENPNYFGVVDDRIDELKELKERKKFMLVYEADPLSLALFKPPSEWNADLAVGEGQPLGLHMNYGGSLLGILVSKKDYLRQLPGRIVGFTQDKQGRAAFCFTLQARDQFIRRGKATSNICTAETLNSCAAAVYLSLMGGNGLKKIAELNRNKNLALIKKLKAMDKLSVPFDGQNHFNRFTVQFDEISPEKVNMKLLEYRLVGGGIAPDYPGFGKSSIFGVTEMHSEENIERLADALSQILEEK
jgi:glycine dehydrogenase subunit 1